MFECVNADKVYLILYQRVLSNYKFFLRKMQQRVLNKLTIRENNFFLLFENNVWIKQIF